MVSRIWSKPSEHRAILTERKHRATVHTAQRRNRLVTALAARILVAHAPTGGKTEAFCREVLAWGKPLYTFAGNENLVEMGTQVIASVEEWHGE
jgi:predicted Rossmann fold nucleotide-binding protein DprA/Smf involved in DNA uptake